MIIKLQAEMHIIFAILATFKMLFTFFKKNQYLQFY